MEPLNKKTRNSAPIEELPTSKFSYQLKGLPSSLLLVLIHGLKSAQQTFLPIIDQLSLSYQVLIYDQRGHGGSPIASWDYSLDSMANDLRNLLEFLGLGKREMVLLGHSAGGRTSMRYCEMYPEMVKGLIIEDMEFIPRKNDGVLATMKEAEELKKLPQKFKNAEELIEILRKQLNKSSIDEILERRSKKNQDGSLEVLYRPWVACLYSFTYQNHDFRGFLKKFDKPLLVIRAEPENSAIGSKGAKDIINCRNKNVEMVLIKGAAHNVHGSKTIEFLKCMELFLKKI